MAISTTGGFSAVLCIPTAITIRDPNKTPAIYALNLRQLIERDANTAQPAYPLQQAWLSMVEIFDGNQELSKNPWSMLHWNALRAGLIIEEASHPHAHIFYQLEISPEGKTHVHILFVKGYNSRQISWAIKRMRHDIVKFLTDEFSKLAPDVPNSQIWAALNNSAAGWLSLNRVYCPKLGKTVPQPVNPFSFLQNYFFAKIDGARTGFVLLRGATENLISLGLKTIRRQDVFNLEANADETTITPLDCEPGSTLPISYVSTTTDWTTKNTNTELKPSLIETLAMEALRLCKEHFIFDQKQFKLKFPELFLRFTSKSQGLQKLEQTISLYCETIIHESNAWEIAKAIHADKEIENIKENKVIKLCHHQNYDPRYVAHTLCCWLAGKLGKKNTIYLYGPANTGKTMFAEALCKMVGLFGNVNHNNLNFPFNDCHNKAILWWEECCMLESYVEAAKCIMGGSGVRVDRKGQDSVLIQKTPIVVTSNNDITQVCSKNATTDLHAAAIRARCIMFKFSNWLSSNWGLITIKDMYEFLLWGECQGEISLNAYFLKNPKFNNTIPYNQPRINICNGCTLQIKLEQKTELCNTCGAWKTTDINEESWDGESEESLYQHLGQGT